MNKDNKKESKFKKFFETYTKIWVSILLSVALIDLQLSYVLAFVGREQIAESLSVAIVTEIIGVAGVYMIRAYLDSATESKHKMQQQALDSEIAYEEESPEEFESEG